MAALMGRCRQLFGLWPLVLLAATGLVGAAPARADTLSINVDQAQIPCICLKKSRRLSSEIR